MNKKLIIFPSYKERKSKPILKVVWLAHLLLTPFIFASASETVTLNSTASSQSSSTKTIVGTVIDDMNQSMPGVTVVVKGTTNGVITDLDGAFSIDVNKENAVLVFSFIGMTSKEVPVSTSSTISVTLESSAELLEDLVVVGYGTQKKESVVGAITHATGEDLMKAGGVTNVGEALQGRLPGVTAINSSGLPGQTDPKIYIRGQASWNGDGQPLILVDGMQRSMSDIDLSEVENISVLKDASATAVFGVEGANGVILITTKRGKKGKAQLSVSGNVTMKMVSKLPDALDGYDAIEHSNIAIMKELMYTEESWKKITPQGIRNKYRYPASAEESYKYPNVDWQDVILKDYAVDSRVNMSVRGGTDFAKYFGSLSYQTTRDIFDGKSYDNGKGYSSEFKYDRFNYRSNLDFDITKTTKVSVNLSGYYGMQEKPTSDIKRVLNPIYLMAPSIYTPLYPDGYYGVDPTGESGFVNPLVALNSAGSVSNSRFAVNSDFVLDQKLDFITKGLKFKGKFSYDSYMTGEQKLNDKGRDNVDNVIYRVYDADGNETIFTPNGINNFDYQVQPWDRSTMSISDGSRVRNTSYSLALNYARTFDKKHNTTGLFLFRRQQRAKGSMFPAYREDWVGRLTYDYDTRYFVDINGAYNGSEKFGPGYRFDFFPSAALGWTVSNEAFMKGSQWLEKLKVRGSYGMVGDDKGGSRFAYATQWGSGGSSYLLSSTIRGKSPYTWYSEDVVGNADLQWETALKSNIGVELGLWQNMFTAEFDYFQEHRSNILIKGKDRTVPEFYGIAPPDANTGEVKVKGFELVLGFNHRFDNGVDLSADFSYTHAVDEVINRDDPALMPDYQKSAGYAIGQPKAPIAADMLTSWDDIYMSTPLVRGQKFRRPGYYDQVDFNGDGNYYGSLDNAPYGYANRPQNSFTYSLTTGYKGFNFLVMFYGAQNSMRYYNSRTFTKETNLVFDHVLDYWTPENQGAEKTLEQWTQAEGVTDPYRDRYDASVFRLKTVELSYNVPKAFSKRIGMESMRVFVNGNNLFLWTDMPDDREYNGSNTEDSSVRGDYPTLKRFNFGFNLNF